MGEQKSIILKLKDKREIQSSYVDEAEADRLMTEEVLPKLGLSGTIQLPGALARSAEVVGAEFGYPPFIGIG